MNRQEFNNLLKQSNLSKKEFCEIIGLKYGAVNNWGSKNINVPIWVESWLENYIERKKLEQMRDIMGRGRVVDYRPR